MKEKINYHKIYNFIKGDYSYKDYLEIRNWFENQEHELELEAQLLQHWNELTETGLQADNSLDYIYQRIQRIISKEENKKSKLLVLWEGYRKMAAILLLPLILFSAWYFTSHSFLKNEATQRTLAESWIEINVPEGSRVKFNLPDGTMGWLNSGAKLKYPGVFGVHRKVELQGEAYFEVTHVDNSDFVVSVSDLDVKVLGTKFNVASYHGDNFTDVVLKEGKVEVIGTKAVFDYILEPNEMACYNREQKKLTISNIDADNYTAWKDGYLIIVDEPMGKAVDKIERWYNVDIVLNDPVLKNYHFKATFKDEPLEEVLRLIAITTPINYKIEERTENENGITNKKRVIIEPKK
ncbi:MAG: DUF4974 domain-containing protein [Bacteroidales bacterium]|nr:DUF4974 domain-containing protein [Bacteroidales bacterium]